MNITKPHKICFIGLVRLCRDRISEKQEQVDLVTGDPRRDLLISALGTAQITYNSQTSCFGDHFSGRSRSTEVRFAQNSAVCDAELYHKLLLGVVSDKCYIQCDPPDSLDVL